MSDAQPNPPAPPGPTAAAFSPAEVLPAWRSSKAWFVFVLTVLLGLVADLGSKELAFNRIADAPFRPNREQVLHILRDAPGDIMLLVPPHAPVKVVPYVLDFQLVLNSGAVFGSGQGKRWFFVGFTAVALLFAVGLFAKYTATKDRVSHIALGLIVSGGIGNLYDRLVYACVRDFIHPLPGVKLPWGITWPHGSDEVWPYISNVADALLLIGIGVVMVKLWRGGRGE